LFKISERESNFHYNDSLKRNSSMPQKNNNNNIILSPTKHNSKINYQDNKSDYYNLPQKINYNNNMQIKNENTKPQNFTKLNIDDKYSMNNNSNINGLNSPVFQGSKGQINNLQNSFRDPNKFHIKLLGHDIISHKNDSYYLNRHGDQFKREEYRKEDFKRPNHSIVNCIKEISLF
jgi:hypothetical protein